MSPFGLQLPQHGSAEAGQLGRSSRRFDPLGGDLAKFAVGGETQRSAVGRPGEPFDPSAYGGDLAQVGAVVFLHVDFAVRRRVGDGAAIGRPG